MTFTLEELRAFIEGPSYDGVDYDTGEAAEREYEAWKGDSEALGDNFYEAPFDWLYFERDREIQAEFETKFGPVKTVAQWNLGDGRERGIIFQIGERFFRKTGYYSSWDSGEWDGELEEVEPYKVVKIRYRPIGAKS